MTEDGKNQSEEYAPDPQVDLLLEEFATAVPAETLLDGFEERVSARLAREIPVVAAASDRAKPAEEPGGEKAAAAAPAAPQAPVAAPGILIPQARRAKGPIFIVAGLVAAAGMAAAAVFLVTRPPETEVVTRTVEEVTYVPVERTAAPTAAPEPETAEMVAMADTDADAGLGDTGEEIGAPSGTTDDDEYVPEDETARLMAAARAKLKSSKGKKKTSTPTADSDDDAGDDILDDSALPATSAPTPTPPPAADPAADPGKAGAFEKDLEELLARKKAAAAAKTVKTAAPEPTKRLLKKSDVKKEIDRASRKIGSCGAIDAGTVTVTWFVEGSGAPSKVSAKAPHGSTALGACVTNIIKGLKFPEHDEEPKKVSYPFVVKSD